MKSWVEHGNDYFVKLQQEITSYALKMLRPGGMLLYSTCTFSPLEDEQIVSRMLKEDPDLELVEPEWYEGFDHGPVSYTHLDVYKRQGLGRDLFLSDNKACA